MCYKEDEDDVSEPSWEKQEAMVRRLQKKFPDQDKEVRKTFSGFTERETGEGASC